MAEASRQSIPDWLRARFTDGQRFMVLCVGVGLLCGIAAVAFHLAIHELFTGLWDLASGLSPAAFCALLVGGPALAGLAVGVGVQYFAPDAAGSGIPQTKAAYYNKGGIIGGFAGIWRWLLGALYVGLGNSLGREGPTVHFSSAIASCTARWAFRDPERQRAMIPVGMAAGIAAAFNAPLSALTFVFEELLDNFSMRALGGMVVAVVIAAAVSRSILGEDPVLPAHLAAHYDTSLWMLVALPMGLAAGLLGHGFVRLVLGVRAGFRKSPLPPWSRPALGGALCGGIALGAFFLTGRYGDAQNSVWSIGYESLERAFEGHIAVQIIAILFFFKLAAVVAAYGSGGSGGLFSPTLFLGGMLGALVGAGAVALDGWVPIPGFPSGEKILGACVLLGMGAMFAAVIRCPFTSLIIIFEMTGSYSLILPLMAGNMIAWRIARRFGPVPIYNALLLQDGVTLRHMPAYRGPQDYQNLPVSAIMTHEVTAVRGSHSCGEALRRLRESGARFRTFPVLGEDDAVSGILAFSEIANADPEATAASLIDDNAHPVVALQPDTSIRDAANKMLHADVRQAPILSAVAPHRLLGYVTLNDIARQQNASAL